MACLLQPVFAPMGNDFVAADGTSGGFEQSSEICFWLSAGSALRSPQHSGLHRGCPDRPSLCAGRRGLILRSSLHPSFLRRRASHGCHAKFHRHELSSSRQSRLASWARLAEHRVGIHLPEHSGFAEAAGSRMGQRFGLSQHRHLKRPDSSARE